MSLSFPVSSRNLYLLAFSTTLFLLLLWLFPLCLTQLASHWVVFIFFSSTSRLGRGLFYIPHPSTCSSPCSILFLPFILIPHKSLSKLAIFFLYMHSPWLLQYVSSHSKTQHWLSWHYMILKSLLLSIVVKNKNIVLFLSWSFSVTFNPWYSALSPFL